MIRKRHNRFASNGSTVSQQCRLWRCQAR